MTPVAVPLARNPVPQNSPRVGAVSYLNSKPLVEGLSERLADRLILDYPSRLAASLAAGDLDVALIPSIEVLRAEGGYEIVSDACVAARGPVRSVKVYFRVPPGDVETLALDEGSRTSAALARVLLHHKYGVEPDTEPLPLENSSPAAQSSRAASDAIASTDADAILLIGDRAMFPVTERFAEVWDLGEEWNRWAGLPFVFAVWAARRGDVPDGLGELLSSVRDGGVSDVEVIARREAAVLGLDPAVAIDYLTKNLHFTLGSAERSGLKLFAQLAHQAGLAPGGIDLVFRDRTPHECDQRRTDDALPSVAAKREPFVGTR